MGIRKILNPRLLALKAVYFYVNQSDLVARPNALANCTSVR